jgi:hypothetical protein
MRWTMPTAKSVAAAAPALRVLLQLPAKVLLHPHPHRLLQVQAPLRLLQRQWM